MMKISPIIAALAILATGCKKQPDPAQAQAHLRKVFATTHPELAANALEMTNFCGWYDTSNKEWVQLKAEFVIRASPDGTSVIYWLQYPLFMGCPTNVHCFCRTGDSPLVSIPISNFSSATLLRIGDK